MGHTRALHGIFLAAIVILIIPTAIQAQQCINGTSVAIHTPGNPLGEYEYCLTVTWDTGSHGLSHWNVILGLANCPCICEDFSFAAEDTAGSSNGESDLRLPDGCTVHYMAEFLCSGDPSIGNDEPLVKFEYIEGDCEPGPSGTGTFCFYSDWPPEAVPTPNALLIVKYAGYTCTGELTGDLPVCTCGPVSTESSTWGSIKELFR